MRTIAFNRIVETPVPLPGGMPLETRVVTEPDLRIELFESAAAAPGTSIYRLDGAVLTFCPPAVATYHCRSDRIDVIPQPEASLNDVIALLLATALPASLWLSGDFVLHASAVRLPQSDRAIAIAGPSGCGKSTLAAALIGCGADLVADDTVAVTLAGEAPMASGLPGGWFSGTERSGPRPFHSIPSNRMVRRCRLGAVVVLSQAACTNPPSRLDPVDSVEHLLSNRHRPAIPAILRKGPDILQFCAFLAGSVPVYLWPRQHEQAAIDDQSLEWLRRCIEGKDRP